LSALSGSTGTCTRSPRYFAGDIAAQLADHLSSVDLLRTTVIVDPPATGLGSDVREILRRYPVPTLLYVSCNPPTLARDLADLDAAYRLESVTPFDMFPQTAEIEALAHLTAA
jgi:23S rRNA (uracil1939-C5)-methyltransferase